MRTTLTLLVSALILAIPHAQPPTVSAQMSDLAKKEPIPQAVRAAWSKADAEFGWTTQGANFRLDGRDQPEAGEIPAFQFRRILASRIATLPAPDVEFGIFFTAAGLTDDHLLQLPRFKNLQTHRLVVQLKFTDAGLKVLPELKKLQHLHLEGTRTGDLAMKHVGTMKQLKTLNLHGTTVTDAGLKDLAELKLEWLALAGRINGSGLKHIAPDNLKYLNASLNIPKDDAAVLGQFRQLRTLVLGGDLKDKTMDVLAGLKELRSLDIHRTAVTGTGLKKLAVLPQLETLYVPHGTRDRDLASLADFPRLQNLYLDKCVVTEDTFKELAKVKTLRSLSLRGVKLTDGCCKELAIIEQLESLDLSFHSGITSGGLLELAKLKNLQHLSLEGTQLKMASVAELQKAMPNLKIKGLFSP